MSYGILILSAAIAGIALDSIDNAVFAFFHDTDMIGLPILWDGAAFIVPIEENDLTSRRLKAAVLPMPTVFEPLHPIDTACKLRDNAAVDIKGYALFIHGNSPIKSESILCSAHEIDKAIHTKDREFLSYQTIEKIKKLLD